jgi:hypothetical protein
MGRSDASEAAAASESVAPVLDHVVINVADRLDEAAALYARLGFQITPRGHHTLGSSNNLAIFEENYLELLGYMPERKQMRPNMWRHPQGLLGLVFKGREAASLHAEMRRRDVPIDEPLHFSRPVELPEGARDARFSVVAVPDDALENGRVYFCCHHTPEVVWRPAWMAHPNGAQTIAEFVIASREPARTAALYDRMFGPGVLQAESGGVGFQAGRARVLVLEPQAAAARYAGATLVSEDGKDRMVALAFKTASLARARQTMDAAGIAVRELPGGGFGVPHEAAANCALAFRE